MRKHLLIFIILAFSQVVSGQHAPKSDNIFFSRAFWKGNPSLEEVKRKISVQNDPVAKSRHAMDATSYAILENSSSEVVDYLLSLDGNDINKSTHDRRNYVMWAAYVGNKSLVKKLLNAGSRTDIIDDHGYNLLTFTAQGGVVDTELYEMILSSGVDIKSTNRDGAHALLISCVNAKDTNLIDFFTSKGLNIKDLDTKGNNAFHYAAKGGNIKMMDKLKTLGLNIMSKNNLGQNAILMAAKGGHRHSNGINVFEYLSALDIAANVIDKKGATPLHYVAGNKDSNVIEFFLDKGVDINAVDKAGNTFFHKSAGRKNSKIFNKYLSKAKDLDLKNKEGKTPLVYALRRKSSPIVNSLIENNANVNVVDKSGSNLIGHLFDSYNNSNALFFYEMIDVLRNKGVNPLEKQAEGNSIIHIATEKLSPQLIQKAISLGADINEKNNDGFSPIQLVAMTAKSPELLKLLIDLGAEKNIKTDLGESVFDLAIANELLNNQSDRLTFLK